MVKPLIPYMRKSSKEDPALSRDRQRRTIRTWAQQNGVKLAAEVWEPGVSGSKHWRERGLGEAVAACERGEAAGIVVEEQSRLNRANLLATAEVLAAIDDAGIRLVCITDGIDTTNGDQELNLGMRALLAREQWKQYARRMEHSKANAVARGVHISGKVPVGYLRPHAGARLERDPKKAKYVKAAFQLRATGAALADVARMLDKRLPGGPGGDGAWNRNTVASLLANRVYLGEARQGKHVKADAHAALVDAATFATVTALARKSETAPHATAKTLLAGIARCGRCGYMLDRNRVSRDYFAYRCRGRSATGVCEAPASAMADKLEALVDGEVLARLRDRKIEQRPARVDVERVHQRLAAVRAKRAPFEDPEYVAVLGVAAATRALAQVDAEIRALEDELADFVVSDGEVSLIDVVDVWPTLTVDEKRHVIGSMVEAVHVSRGPRGVPLDERTAITWRGDVVPVIRPTRGRTKVKVGAAAA